MKKIILCLVIMIASLSLNEVNAQHDTSASNQASVNVGLQFCPQGELLLNKHAEEGFSTVYPLFVVVQIIKGPFLIMPFYSLTENSAGMVVEYAVLDKLSLYGVGNKSVYHRGGYMGFGLNTPVANHRAFAFAEIGTTWETYSRPAIYTGLIIPFTVKVK